MIEKNYTFEAELTDLNNLGNAVTHLDGMTIFVPNGADGDRAVLKIIKVAKDYAVARIEEIIEPSPYREAQTCPVYKRCGGCVYRHITRKHELQLKQNYVKNALRKAGLPDINVAPVTHGELSEHYRNKVQYPVSDSGKIGFFAQHSHDIVPIESCLLVNQGFDSPMNILREYVKKHPGIIKYIYMRKGEITGELMICLVSKYKTIPDSNKLVSELRERVNNLKSVILNHNPANTNVILSDKFISLYGKPYIEDFLCGLRFRISAGAFYQVNHEVAELLYKKVAELASGSKKILDLYCGAGTIGLYIASLENEVTLKGVDIVQDAIKNAALNAAVNGIENASFECADAGIITPEYADAVILDPPRKGCTPELLRAIDSAGINKIVYVSCSPDTFARDAVILKKLGYDVSTVYPFDMFPRTGHVETVCFFSKLQNQQHIDIELNMDELAVTNAEK